MSRGFCDLALLSRTSIFSCWSLFVSFNLCSIEWGHYRSFYLCCFLNLLCKYKICWFLFISTMSLGPTYLISCMEYNHFLLMLTQIRIATSCLKQWLRPWFCMLIGSLMFMNCCCVKNLVIGVRLDQLLGTPNSLWLNMMTTGGLNIFKLI